MFNSLGLDQININAPTRGMNVETSPDNLSQDYATWFENMILKPVGEASVRFGTTILEGSLLPVNSKIIGSFPFINTNGNKQIVLYISQLILDGSYTAFDILAPNQFVIETDNIAKYIVGSRFGINYTNGAAESKIQSLYVDNIEIDGNTVIITSNLSIFPDDFSQCNINDMYYDDGQIFVYDFGLKTTIQKKTGLSTSCTPRSVSYLDALIICNGVDNIMSWNGTDLNVIFDVINEDTVDSFSFISVNQFSMSLSDRLASQFNMDKYYKWQTLYLVINDLSHTLTISDATELNNTVTITTNEPIPNFSGADDVQLYYMDKPPAFSYLAVAHNRLWGLAPSSGGLSYRDDPDQCMRVYFAYKTGSYTRWFSETLKVVPSIDLSRQSDVFDNLEAICPLAGSLVFFGRNRIQIWSGSEPLGGAIDPTMPQFTFERILNIGIFHGSLLISMPNDIFFISENGMVSLSDFNMMRQFGITSFSNMDSLIRQYISTCTQKDYDYRSCTNFKYDGGPFSGFKIGKNNCIVATHTTQLNEWSVFSGDFLYANCFVSGFDFSLYLAMDNGLCVYSNTTSGQTSYSDCGFNLLNYKKKSINFSWSTPLLKFNNRIIANKRYELDIFYTSNFVLNKANSIQFLVHSKLPNVSTISEKPDIKQRSDILGIIPLSQENLPNLPTSLSQGYRVDPKYISIKDRLKFMSSEFYVNISGSIIDSPLRINQLKLWSVIQRT